MFAYESVCVNWRSREMTDKQDAEKRLDELRLKRLKERGERLREERKRLGFSLAEFANLLGIHRNTQGNYEAGREPPSSYLIAAQLAGVDIAYVMDGARTRGVAALCASAVATIFERASDRGLSQLDPCALSILAGLIVEDEVHKDSESEGEIDPEQLNALISEAFQRPREFYVAATAIRAYAPAEPLPGRSAALILETLERYRECLTRDSPVRSAPSVHDGIRTVAEFVVRTRDRSTEHRP